MVSLQDYEGREQAYVKHVFLESYLERLVHKTASSYSHIVYVDGFAGPWQSANERFEDTSFGIALGALRRAKISWKNLGKDVTMSAHLVEQNISAYQKLAVVPEKFPDVRVATYQADFLEVFPKILAAIPSDAFVFFFIDPKGWNVPLQKLEKLLARDRSEIIFNFMFDFINRAVRIKQTAVAAGLDALIPLGDWRRKLEDADKANLSSDERKSILVDAFGASLAKLGGYRYVAETTVLRPLKNRPLYCLFYATRHKTGIEVFRDSQVKALSEQADTRAVTKIKHAATSSGQHEMFESFHDMGPDKAKSRIQSGKLDAEKGLLDLVPLEPEFILYEELWPQVLAQHVVRLADINEIVARFKNEGKLLIPDWEARRRVPQDRYRVQRPASPPPRTNLF